MSETTQKSHPFLRAIFVLLVIAAIIFAVVKICEKVDAKNKDNPDTGLLSRPANNGDILVDSDLDLSNLGEKVLITPQYDIDGLAVRIDFYDSSDKVLASKSYNVGNVKAGVQQSISISLFDMSLSVSWNARTIRCVVVGGTVSYFA